MEVKRNFHLLNVKFPLIHPTVSPHHTPFGHIDSLFGEVRERKGQEGPVN